jgi:hypothetical protein
MLASLLWEEAAFSLVELIEQQASIEETALASGQALPPEAARSLAAIRGLGLRCTRAQLKLTAKLASGAPGSSLGSDQNRLRRDRRALERLIEELEELL